MPDPTGQNRPASRNRAHPPRGVKSQAKASPADALSAVVNGLLAQSAIGFIAINLWEETAWMGFVQARLQARRGMLLGAVLTAALFTLQHLPLFADNGVGVLLIAPVFFALAFPFRALVGWLYNRT